ncbi:MAG: PAS domain-containing protein [Actinomycetota bacterium]
MVQGPISAPVAEDGDAYKELLERLPAVVYSETVSEGVTTPEFVSRQIEDMLGIPVQVWMTDPDVWERQLHPSDRRWAADDYRRALTRDGTWTAEYRVISTDGRIVWLHDRADIVRKADGSVNVQGAFFDVTERKAVEAALRRRDAVLRAVGFAAERFLRADSWTESIEEVLARLGTSADVSRVYVFENRKAPDGALLMDQTYEWCAPGISSTIEIEDNHGWPYVPDYQHYVDVLGSGGVIAGKQSDFVGADRRDLLDEQTLATAFVPIFVGGEWWGFLGFDDCVTERQWSSTELDALKAAAGTLGAVIARELAETARAELERRYRTLVEQIPAITYIDVVDDPDAEEYPTIYISPQVESILGYTPEEWLADDTLWNEMLHPDDRERVMAEDLEVNHDLAPYVGEYRLVRRDGRVVWIHDEARVLGDAGETQNWHGVMFDITKAKEAEHALSQALEREQEQTERLSDLNETKNTLLHAVSHDLRNPLTALLGATSALERAGTSLSPEDIAVLIQGLGQNARKMNRLIRDLLDLDRLDRGVVEPRRQTVELLEIARRAVDECDGLEGRIVHVGGESLSLAVDPAQIERVVENLVLNAAKHTPPGTPVWITVRPHDDGAVICVEDGGPGVPESLQRTIFEPFRQGQAGGQGVGIGLSLVAHFAELHGGRAWVEDRSGGGASFRVFLPNVSPEEFEGRSTS